MSDGSVLRGKTAAKYLHTKLKNYERLIEDVDCVLSRSLKSNHIVEENTLANTVIYTKFLTLSLFYYNTFVTSLIYDTFMVIILLV